MNRGYCGYSPFSGKSIYGFMIGKFMGIAHGDIICFIEFHGGQQWNDCRIVMEEDFHGIAMDKCQMWMNCRIYNYNNPIPPNLILNTPAFYVPKYL
jgi:hypothetical protein